MSEELFEHRITALEGDVKVLYSKMSSVSISQAQANTKLDSMIETLDEMKTNISELKKRPLILWDKFLFALIGAIGTGIGTFILFSLNGG